MDTKPKDGRAEAVENNVGLAGGAIYHTPGPWGAYAELKSGGLHTIWTEDTNGDPHPFTKLIARTCLAPGSEGNARLMAAAPDLLAECVKARSVLRTALDDVTNPTGKNVINRRIETLTAAITKARGQAA